MGKCENQIIESIREEQGNKRGDEEQEVCKKRLSDVEVTSKR